MGTYHNDYSKNEDFMLWELHEVRHRLKEEHKKMSVNEINERANKVRKAGGVSISAAIVWEPRRAALHI